MYQRQQLLFLSLLLLLVSCRENERATQLPTKSDNSANQSHVASDGLVDVLNITHVPLPHDSDPAQEGWKSEAIAAKASQRLNQLGESVLSKELPIGLATGAFKSDQLVPVKDELLTCLETEVVRVDRWTPSTSPGTQTLEEAIDPLRTFLTGLADQKFKFKLFRIENSAQSEPVTTHVYAHFSGKSKDQARELNATWVVAWKITSGQLRIDSIELKSYEQTTLRINRQFTDLTESALGHNKSYASAIVPGIPHWRKRLEYSLGVYNFGHHGLSVGDVNGDGLEDLYVCQTGGLPNHLFVQNPDGTFHDTSSQSKLDYLDNTRSALLIDLDNDDDQDIVLALNSGLLFLENRGSTGFNLRARIRSVRQAFSLASADYDQDGLLDIFICVYYGSGDDVSQLPVPVPYFNASNGGHNHLIRNVGNWKFEDVTEAVGLDADNQRFSFAATWEDYDLDGDSDLFVVNDFGPNQLYENTNGHFKNVATKVGLVDGAFGMSSSFGDFDRDGFQDLYVGNMFSAAGNRVTFQPQFKPNNDSATRGRFQHLARGNSLFRNLGDGTFQDVSVAQGVTMGRWSWSSLFADINCDGWDDLVVTNGFVTGDSKDDL